MTNKRTLGWLHFSLFGLLLWFFGNLYEEVILMPNWLVAPLDVLQAYNRYYSVVIQYHYYVPVTQLAVLALIWLCLSQNPARQLAPIMLKRAAIWGGLGTLLTIVIVTQINVKLFLGSVAVPEVDAHRLGFLWMLGNAIRLFCVGKAIGYTLSARDTLRGLREAQ
ncbi:hypothetical protein ACAW74_09205 [Fibrella sp. WM1]|uniref:hypothetical protein n=1 Tax=Fibrella musci TaxID=3242485 RepID=UPI0035226083